MSDPAAASVNAGAASELSGTDLDAHLTTVGIEILVAELRARFYHAKFILGRTYVFKALHFPRKVTEKDVEHCVSAIAAGCMWPPALATARQKKRLLPHLFTWTQNFDAMRVILRISRTNECLRNLCNDRLGPRRTERVTTEMLQWIRDVKQIDGIADWSWNFLQSLFAEPVPKLEG